jgi:hypothetical protein
MAVKLIGNYAKRLGLPGYSSHQFSVSVETELTDLGQAQEQVARLYALLQDAVDREMLQTGFVPNEFYGVENNGTPRALPASNGTNGESPWKCSDKQRELIERLVVEHELDKQNVDSLAQERFGSGVRQLNKLQASGLIDELLESCNTKKRNGTNGHRRPAGRGGHR